MTEDELVVVDRWETAGERGVGWQLASDELERTSHAIAVESEGDASVWLCDPLDAPGLDDLLAEYGAVAGVVVQLDRHHRDAETLARRHDVPVYLPGPLADETDEFDCETRVVTDELAETGYHSITIVDNPLWREAALFAPERGTLVVPEAVGTVDFFRAGSERIGVHPVLRAFPPRRTLGDVDPDRLLVGHGTGIFEEAAAALRDALRRSRRSAPRAFAEMIGSLF